MVSIVKTKILLLAICAVNLAGVAALLIARRPPSSERNEPTQPTDQPAILQPMQTKPATSAIAIPPRPEHVDSGDDTANDTNVREIIRMRSVAFDIAEATATELPNNPSALSLLGRLHLRSSNPDSARALWEAAMQLEPAAPEPYLDYGHLELNLGNLTAAEKYFRQALERNPDLLEAYAPLAEAKVTQTKYADALPTLREWLKRQPGAVKAHIQLAKCQQELGDFEEAIASYHTALSNEPNSREAAMGLIATYRAQGDRSKAAEAAEVFAKSDANDPRILGERNVVDRDREKMSELLTYTVQTAANLFLSSDNTPAAIAQLELAVPFLPDAPDVRSRLAELYAADGRYDKSIKLLRAACERDREDANAWMTLALFCMKVRQLELADDALQQVVRLLPNDDYAYRLRAQTQMAQARDLPGAVASAQRALELSPVAANHYLLGTAFYHARNYQAAKAALRQAIAIEPDNAEFSRALAAIP